MTRLSAERVRELLHYNPATGMFRWRVLAGKRKAGTVAGCIDSKQYRIITIENRPYKAHRLAWLYCYGEWPVGHLDHKNNIPNDNRIANLRPATRSQNVANSRRSTRNTSGYKGVSWNSRTQRWVAKVFVNGRLHYLGLFTTVEEAHAVYSAAATKHFGIYARTQ